jgi:hypothetical protein
LVAFNRNYIPHTSHLVKPPNDLISIKGKMMSYWKDKVHGKAIRDIKHAFTIQPVMMLPDPAGEFRIHVDSCTEGYGCGAMWSVYDPERLAEILEQVISVDIEPTRRKQ